MGKTRDRARLRSQLAWWKTTTTSQMSSRRRRRRNPLIHSPRTQAASSSSPASKSRGTSAPPVRDPRKNLAEKSPPHQHRASSSRADFSPRALTALGSVLTSRGRAIFLTSSHNLISEHFPFQNKSKSSKK